VDHPGFLDVAGEFTTYLKPLDHEHVFISTAQLERMLFRDLLSRGSGRALLAESGNAADESHDRNWLS